MPLAEAEGTTPRVGQAVLYKADQTYLTAEKVDLGKTRA